MISQKWECKLWEKVMEESVKKMNGLQWAGKHTSMVKIQHWFTILIERQPVKVQNNSELEITKFQDVGIWHYKWCPKVKWLKYTAHHFWIRVVALITLDKVELLGSKRTQQSLMNLKYLVANSNLISQKTSQLSLKDVSLSSLIMVKNN